MTMTENTEPVALTQQNFDAIERGMTFPEVCAILGEPDLLSDEQKAQLEPGILVSSLASEVYEWRQGERLVRVLFTNGTMNDKVAFNLE